MRQRATTRARAGFTVIEVLVVIAIIAVLTGMLLVGIQKVKGRGKDAQVTDELAQLQAAVTKFETNVYKGQGHIPSRLMLCEDGAYPSNQLGNDSKNFLSKCFPGIILAANDWNGNGQIDAGNAGHFTLDGSQCLVFLLGGINGTKGFSNNTRNPTNFSAPGRIDPAFSFKLDRLNTAAPYSAAFPAFNDPHGKPYAFFSSYYKTNGYNRYGTSDCANLGVSPYFTPRHTSNSADYYNPSSFQIISAGKDGVFGPGGLYPPPPSEQARDDMTNFHQGILAAQ